MCNTKKQDRDSNSPWQVATSLFINKELKPEMLHIKKKTPSYESSISFSGTKIELIIKFYCLLLLGRVQPSSITCSGLALYFGLNVASSNKTYLFNYSDFEDVLYEQIHCL